MFTTMNTLALVLSFMPAMQNLPEHRAIAAGNGGHSFIKTITYLQAVKVKRKDIAYNTPEKYLCQSRTLSSLSYS